MHFTHLKIKRFALCSSLISTSLFLINTLDVSAQARIVLSDNIVMNINGGASSNPAYIVVDNTNPNAITSSGSGNIHSEGEFNVIRWNIGNGTGVYTVPFGDDDNDVLPVTMHISSAGSAGGVIDFSSYPTANDNTPFPVGVGSVAHQNDPNNLINQGFKIYNRFWMIKSNHTTIPSGNLSFAYKAEGMTGDLSFGSTSMAAQFHNGTSWSINQFGADNNSGLVSGVNFSASSFGGAWTLVQNGAPLPITLLSFNAVWADENQSVARIFWSTASELDNDFFQVQRSKDGFNWYNVQKVEGAGSSINTIDYEIFDTRPLNGISYYRLKQVDYDGTESYSNVVALNRDLTNPLVEVYPNPANSIFNIYFSGFGKKFVNVDIIDNSGRVVMQFHPNVYNNPEHMIDVSNFQSGLYHIQVRTEDQVISQKIVVRN